MMHGQKNINK